METDNPIYFPQLSSKIQSSNISILEEYRKQTEARIVKYKEQIEKIEKEIEKAYETIRSTPYHLYSILMHEGSAENGHYYSYILDLEKQVWRKYNDINISEEVEEQILKEAKGLNFTSAYYLVYAKQDVLLAGAPMRNYKLSQDEGYMTDVYSQFLSKPLK